LGTRGSLLAKTQSQLIASELEKRNKGLAVELIIIKTTGDEVQDKSLMDIGGKGLFTKEIEQALLNKEIDFAVHSFKDVPVTQPLVDQADLIIASVPQREDPRDVFCSLVAKSIAELPQGARVGTSSTRRKCQMLELRPDVRIEPLRGNIDTRLRKLREGNYDAIILAAAGVRRTGLFHEAEMTMLEPEQMLPAPGQGALALQCRREDASTRELLEAIQDPQAEQCVIVERMIVAALGGDCHSPIAALAQVVDGEMNLRVAVGKRDGLPPVLRAEATCPAERSDCGVEPVLKSLSEQGVQKILRA
jgi:hydroxymethylbilane synthase